MTDEEYVSYVRARMWEKSHEHVLEERAKQDAERVRKKMKQEEAKRWEEDVEEALRRGEERRRRRTGTRTCMDAWQRYTARWDAFLQSSSSTTSMHEESAAALRKSIPWPVPSGRWQDVDHESVEHFFLTHAQCEESDDLRGVLKVERVRWHPDKMQQRAGAAGTGRMDAETMKMVTAVFQVVDGLWLRSRDKSKS